MFHYIDVLIGFVSIMLLFSLIVTTLTQTVQAWIRIRARSVFTGLCIAVDRTLTHSKLDCVKIARKIMLSPVFHPDKSEQTSIKDRSFMNMDISINWIDPELIPDACNNIEINKQPVNITSGEAQKIATAFANLDDWIRKLFSKRARGISYAFAFLIAFGFQLSTPDLLGRLSTDSEFLNSAINAGNSLQQRYTREDLMRDYLAEASEKALADVAREFPEIQEPMEEFSGLGDKKSDVIDEFRDLIEYNDFANSSAIIASFESNLLTHLKESQSILLEALDDQISQAASINLTLWPDNDFYTGENILENFVGVLMSAFLIALGAPFWFDQLKRLGTLKETTASLLGEEKNGKADK